MKDLIARLETATAGSRELDQDIHHQLDLCSKNADGSCNDYLSPDYTTSLDAAASLAREGWSFSVVRTTTGKGKAAIWNHEHLSQASLIFETPLLAATPAIALCIEILKARMS